jgi:hypothetical protein
MSTYCCGILEHSLLPCLLIVAGTFYYVLLRSILLTVRFLGTSSTFYAFLCLLILLGTFYCVLPRSLSDIIAGSLYPCSPVAEFPHF